MTYDHSCNFFWSFDLLMKPWGEKPISYIDGDVHQSKRTKEVKRDLVRHSL